MAHFNTHSSVERNGSSLFKPVTGTTSKSTLPLIAPPENMSGMLEELLKIRPSEVIMHALENVEKLTSYKKWKSRILLLTSNSLALFRHHSSLLTNRLALTRFIPYSSITEMLFDPTRDIILLRMCSASHEPDLCFRSVEHASRIVQILGRCIEDECGHILFPRNEDLTEKTILQNFQLSKPNDYSPRLHSIPTYGRVGTSCVRARTVSSSKIDSHFLLLHGFSKVVDHISRLCSLFSHARSEQIFTVSEEVCAIEMQQRLASEREAMIIHIRPWYPNHFSVSNILDDLLRICQMVEASPSLDSVKSTVYEKLNVDQKILHLPDSSNQQVNKNYVCSSLASIESDSGILFLRHLLNKLYDIRRYLSRQQNHVVDKTLEPFFPHEWKLEKYSNAYHSDSFRLIQDQITTEVNDVIYRITEREVGKYTSARTSAPHLSTFFYYAFSVFPREVQNSIPVNKNPFIHGQQYRDQSQSRWISSDHDLASISLSVIVTGIDALYRLTLEKCDYMLASVSLHVSRSASSHSSNIMTHPLPTHPLSVAVKAPSSHPTLWNMRWVAPSPTSGPTSPLLASKIGHVFPPCSTMSTPSRQLTSRASAQSLDTCSTVELDTTTIRTSLFSESVRRGLMRWVSEEDKSVSGIPWNNEETTLQISKRDYGNQTVNNKVSKSSTDSFSLETASKIAQYFLSTQDALHAAFAEHESLFETQKYYVERKIKAHLQAREQYLRELESRNASFLKNLRKYEASSQVLSVVPSFVTHSKIPERSRVTDAKAFTHILNSGLIHFNMAALYTEARDTKTNLYIASLNSFDRIVLHELEQLKANQSIQEKSALENFRNLQRQTRSREGAEVRERQTALHFANVCRILQHNYSFMEERDSFLVDHYESCMALYHLSIKRILDI